MWFLSCDGDHLEGRDPLATPTSPHSDSSPGKSVWLRPGSKHLFGRTHPAEGFGHFHAITNKSVSRRHFELHVAPVRPGDSAKIHTRSTITIKDLGSKAGTHVDNEKIKGDNLEHSFNSGDHVLRLGNYDVPFRIKWRPVVFSFTGISRSARQSNDPLISQRTKLEELDIKCVTEYVVNQTSHVVTEKRNTAMALQALVNGQVIVKGDYLDAVQKAAERPPSDGDTVTASPLEEDWSLHWPKQLDYLPGPGQEPHPRPEHDEIFLPQPARSEMFSKYIFVFMTEKQYQNFLPVITGGGGKALVQEVPHPDHNPDFDSFLGFVKGCAGRKGDAAFRLSQHPAEKGGVIVVRPGDATKTGGVEFVQRLDLALDQRSVQQNEFLEAILLVDATMLRRPLEVDFVHDDADERPGADTGNAAAPSRSNDSGLTPPQSSAPTRRRRDFTRKKVTTFDDFDPSQIQRNSPPPAAVSRSPSQSQRSSADADFAASQPATQGRKRPADTPLRPVETTGQVFDNLFTSAATAKRRRLDTTAKRAASQALESDDEITSKRSHTKKRKSDKEDDVMAQVKAQRESEDKRRQAEEEVLRLAMDGVDYEAVRQGLVIEDMPVRSASATPGDHWREEWNGRANWKRFKKRKAGEDRGDDGPSQRKVIVSLEVFKEGSLEMEWGTNKGARYSHGNTSQRDRHDEGEQNGMRRRRRGVLATGSQEAEAGEDSELRDRIERSRIDDEREEEERENDVLDMGNVRDPEMRKRQEDAKRREKEKKRDRLSQLTSHAPISQGSERSSLLSGLREMDKGKEKAGVDKGRKRPREQIEEEDEEGGTKFRRRRRG